MASHPSIPQAALDAIGDANVKSVLQALADGYNLRNDSGKDGFVTRGDLMSAASGGTSSGNAVAVAVAQTVNGQLKSAIAKLHAQVFESRLFKTLASSIETIGDKTADNGNTLQQEIQNRQDADNAIYQSVYSQFTAIDGNLSGIQQTQATIANNVAAMAQTISTIQATVGENTAAIQSESEVRANSDAELFAQYTLRLDVNGHISGFGLASDKDASQFIVRADVFSIVSPTGNNSALVMTNNTMIVYDENGVARVVIGKLP